MLGISWRLPDASNIATPLFDYLKANFSKEEVDRVANAVKEIQAGRDRIHQAIARSETDFATMDVLLNSYYQSLLAVSLHFPYHVTSSSTSGNVKFPFVRGSFSWYESFRHTQKISDLDIGYERNSILFNLAACYSLRATQVKSQGGENGLKLACQYFQTSASVFEYIMTKIRESPSQVYGLSTDFSTEGLTMLRTLMLAQAQACFFEKSIATSSQKVVAKLAMGVWDLFRQTSVEATRPKLKALSGRKDVFIQWETHLQHQSLCYAAAAYYWNSRAYQSEEKIGEEIALLQRAKSLVDQASRLEKLLLRNLQDDRLKLENAITNRLNAANNQNETIYYTTIPIFESIPSITPVIMVKVTPFSIEFNPEYDHFSSLVPPGIRQQESLVRTRLNDLLQSTRHFVQEHNDICRSHLNSLNLPAAIEVMETSGLPEQLWFKIHEMQLKGGQKSLHDLFSRIQIAVKETENAIQNVSEPLQKERADDQSMRAQFGHRWNCRPSEQLTAQFSRELEIIQSFVKDADKSNVKIKTELQTGAQLLTLIESTRADLEARFPAAAVEHDSNVENIRKQMDELTAFNEKRLKIVDEMKNSIATVDVLGQLRTMQPKSDEQMLAEFTVPYEQLKTQINELNESQREACQKLTADMNAFEQQRVQNDRQRDRQFILQQLNDGVNLFTKLLANCNEGLDFYSELQAVRIAPLKQRVDDFIMAREMEKRVILEQLMKSATTTSPATASVSDRDSISSNQASYQQPPSMSTAINPNLAVENRQQPMYQFSAPTESAASAPVNEFNALSLKSPTSYSPSNNNNPNYNTLAPSNPVQHDVSLNRNAAPVTPPYVQSYSQQQPKQPQSYNTNPSADAAHPISYFPPSPAALANPTPYTSDPTVPVSSSVPGYPYHGSPTPPYVPSSPATTPQTQPAPYSSYAQPPYQQQQQFPPPPQAQRAQPPSAQFQPPVPPPRPSNLNSHNPANNYPYTPQQQQPQLQQPLPQHQSQPQYQAQQYQPSPSPYGSPVTSGNPFASAPSPSNPFAPAPSSTNPFAQAPSPTNAYTAPPPSQQQWECPACTLLNHPNNTKCSVCENPRPGGLLSSFRR